MKKRPSEGQGQTHNVTTASDLSTGVTLPQAVSKATQERERLHLLSEVLSRQQVTSPAPPFVVRWIDGFVLTFTKVVS
jgi:hypothetical protein